MNPGKPNDSRAADSAHPSERAEPPAENVVPPAQPSAHEAGAEPNRRDPGTPFLERGTVFLVDDDQALRRALRRLLTSCGFRVLEFGSAEEFLEAKLPATPGCLLLDLRMGGMSGLGVQATLAERGATLPIVFLTGHATARTKEFALKQGAVGFLEKPAREHELVAMLDRALASG